MKLSKREPVAVRTAIVGAVVAVVHLLVVFGVIAVDQEGAIVATVDALAALAVIVWVRRGVVPSAKVIARVSTSTGNVVAGDAAATSTGTVLGPATVDGDTYVPPVKVDPRVLPDSVGGGV